MNLNIFTQIGLIATLVIVLSLIGKPFLSLAVVLGFVAWKFRGLILYVWKTKCLHR